MRKTKKAVQRKRPSRRVTNEVNIPAPVAAAGMLATPQAVSRAEAEAKRAREARDVTHDVSRSISIMRDVMYNLRATELVEAGNVVNALAERFIQLRSL